MPRGYQYIFIALIGWLSFAANSQASKGENSNEQSGSSRQINKTAKKISTPVRNAIEPMKEDRGCQGRKDNRQSDLCAQWKAADAARDAADWAWWQMIFSGVGVIGLGVTLWFNRRALQIALDATDDVEEQIAISARGADAMGAAAHAMRRVAKATGDQNRLFAESMKRQLRAYISIEPGGINVPEDGSHQVPFNIINNGQTPAYELETAGDFMIVTGDPRTFDPAQQGRLSADTAKTDFMLGPRSNRFSYAYLETELCKPFWEDIHTKKAAIVHYGYIKYRDVFGHERRTSFAFYHWGKELSDVESKRCRYGNDAT